MGLCALERRTPRMSTSLKLNNGLQMPVLGLGTWHHNDSGTEMQDAVVTAIEMGYRHIDCAYIYLNEKLMGKAFSTVFDKGIVKREDLWITSKLWNTEHAAEHVEAACRSTLADLQLDYLDLYLIHWPTGFIHGEGNVPVKDGKVLYSGVSIMEVWGAMEKLVDLGLTKAIGFSNFNSKQIGEVLEKGRIKPAVLQVESNPRFNNEALRRFCCRNDITMVAFSPFGSPDLGWGKKLPHVLVDETLTRIAKEIGKSTAQVVLRWQHQRGVGVIPKSIIPSELANNLEMWGWELTEQQCKLIDGLETGERKINPVIAGTDEIRDKEDINYGMDYIEPFN